jgi:hypothetical protein
VAVQDYGTCIKRVDWAGFEEQLVLFLQLLPFTGGKAAKMAEVVGSNPTRSIFIYEVTTALNHACSRKLSDKLERLLKVKEEREKQEAMYMEDIQRLVTEIEMLKVVYCIW